MGNAVRLREEGVCEGTNSGEESCDEEGSWVSVGISVGVTDGVAIGSWVGSTRSVFFDVGKAVGRILIVGDLVGGGVASPKERNFACILA